MSKQEISMLVVKPDGVAKGLVDEIRQIILSYNLEIVEEAVETLNPGTVEKLYWEIDDIRHRDYFSQLIEFMSSAPVHIFIVQGIDAVSKIRAIIGKRMPASGIRQRWAESIIHNVAHGPHSPERAKEEIFLLTGKEI